MLKNRWLVFVGFFILLYGLLLVVSRNPLIVDDVHPSKVCPNLLAKADVLYVTPFLNNASIAEDKEWCNSIRGLNKSLGLHGISHRYHEFVEPQTHKELEQAIFAFEACFNQTPALFRPPYNAISQENEDLVKKFGMQVYKSRYIVHPYCHCQPENAVMAFLNLIIGC